MKAITATDPESARILFERDGFCITPPLLDPDLVQRAVEHMDSLIAGHYETGVPPLGRTWNPGDDPSQMIRIDQPHYADKTMFELASHPEVGKWAAALTGAKFIQVWQVQMMLKPTGGSRVSMVGWHQDVSYWRYWEGEILTAWLALSDVTEAAGPMHYVPGSHGWGFVEPSNVSIADLDGQKEAIEVPQGESWEEVQAVLPPGAVSFHHRLSLHASGANLSGQPRRSLVLRLRTETSRPVQGWDSHYTSHLNDYLRAPVIYEGLEGAENQSLERADS